MPTAELIDFMKYKAARGGPVPQGGTSYGFDPDMLNRLLAKPAFDASDIVLIGRASGYTDDVAVQEVSLDTHLCCLSAELEAVAEEGRGLSEADMLRKHAISRSEAIKLSLAVEELRLKLAGQIEAMAALPSVVS